MKPEARKRWLIGGTAILAGLTAAVIVAFGVAVSVLKERVVQALGPTSEMAALRVAWSGVVIEGLRIPGPRGWPTGDALRAERVTVVPSLLSLVSGDTYRIGSVTVTRPYLSALRSRGGRLIALPGFHGDPTAEPEVESGSLTVRIGEIALADGVLELFDATVASPPLKIRLEQIEASVRGVTVPALLGRSHFELDGVVKGLTEDGRAHLAGWAEIGTRDSSIGVQLRSVDLVPFQRYLIRRGEAGILAGRFDLELQSDVHDEHLNAPGRITIIGLRLEPADGAMSTFMGLSRRATLAALEEKGGTITTDFLLEGDIDKPDFSLNEALSTRLAYSLADMLGVSVSGLVEGVGTLGLRGGQAAGEAAIGLGGAIWDLFDDEPDPEP